MKRSRALLGLVGTAVFLLGIATVVAPETAAALPVEAAVDLLGSPYVFVAAFGVVAFVVVVSVLLARAIGGLDESTPPDPEDIYRVPTAGHRFDAFVEGSGSISRRLFGSRHERVRQRVRQAAITTLMRTEGLSRSEAETAVTRGTWTDDAAAAAFLSDRQRPTLGQRLAAVVRGESQFQHGARRAALAVARHDEVSR